jgi:hypothetical protein
MTMGGAGYGNHDDERPGEPEREQRPGKSPPGKTSPTSGADAPTAEDLKGVAAVPKGGGHGAGSGAEKTGPQQGDEVDPGAG